jgi:hypothetical protein
MSFGVFLVLDLQGEKAFDADALCKTLHASTAVRNYVENSLDCRFSLEFEHQGHRAEAYMPANDRRYIVVNGEEEAVLQFATELQLSSDSPIHIVDRECTFDIVVSSVTSLADFSTKIEANWGLQNILAARKD